jgi:hypothetical protein
MNLLIIIPLKQVHTALKKFGNMKQFATVYFPKLIDENSLNLTETSGSILHLSFCLR